MPKKNTLTKRNKVYYNSSKPIKHCGHVIAFALDGAVYVQCRQCKEWIRIENIK